MAATADTAHGEPLPLRTYSVLLVEDDRNARELAHLLFERDEQFAIVGEAASADEALAFVDERPVDVVILDHQLEGGVTGSDVAKLLKARAPNSRVVLFSGYLQPSAAAAPQATAVVDAFVHKLHGELLVPTVREVLGLELGEGAAG